MRCGIWPFNIPLCLTFSAAARQADLFTQGFELLPSKHRGVPCYCIAYAFIFGRLEVGNQTHPARLSVVLTLYSCGLLINSSTADAVRLRHSKHYSSTAAVACNNHEKSNVASIPQGLTSGVSDTLVGMSFKSSV